MDPPRRLESGSFFLVALLYGLEPLSCASRPSSYSRDGWILASNESIRASCQARSLIEKASAITRRSDGRAAVSRRLLFACPVRRAG